MSWEFTLQNVNNQGKEVDDFTVGTCHQHYCLIWMTSRTTLYFSLVQEHCYDHERTPGLFWEHNVSRAWPQQITDHKIFLSVTWSDLGFWILSCWGCDVSQEPLRMTCVEHMVSRLATPSFKLRLRINHWIQDISSQSHHRTDQHQPIRGKPSTHS